MGKSGSDGKGIIHVDAGALSLALNGKIFQHSSCLSAWGEISPIQLSEIMNSVRNRVFDFSLALWKKYPNAGEVGVADTTKKIAQAQVHQIFNTTINGGNTQVIGQATDSNLINGVVAGDVQSLKKSLSELKVPNAEIEELGAILIEEPQLTPSGTYGPKLSKWVGKLVEKSADGSWKVAIGAAGGLLASALRAYFHMGP